MIPANASSAIMEAVSVEGSVRDFRSDREARNQLVSYVQSSSDCAFVFISNLTVDGGLLGNLPRCTTQDAKSPYQAP